MDKPFTDSIPHLNIKTMPDGTVRLENESMGDSYIVDVHPVHLRHIAEKMGLFRELTASDADNMRTIAEQARDLDRLKRNMLRVREHALRLQNSFANDADWRHADLSVEMGLINALVDLLDMAVDDFADDFTAHEPTPYAPPMARQEMQGANVAAVKRGVANEEDSRQATAGSEPGSLFADTPGQS